MIAIKNTNILVDEAIYSLVHIAKIYLEMVKPLVVAITGSVGETTTKELCLAIARSKYKSYGTFESYNSLLGGMYCNYGNAKRHGSASA